MKRRVFFKRLAGAAIGLTVALSGCMSRVSETAKDPEQGEPWRCQKCGHLTRSTKDLTDHRCPRCMTKNYRRVTEEEFEKWLAA